MSLYFASDQHICLTHPERGRRFARFLSLLDPKSDRLIIAGDLCDFWFVSRESRRPEATDEAGLKTLREFIDAGGKVTLLPGNHDMHLESFYRKALGLSFSGDLDLEIPGERPATESLKTRVVHGHLLGGRSQWKGLMEGRGFLAGFKSLPRPVADNLAGLLRKYNSRNRHEDNLRHYHVYEDHVRGAKPSQFSHYDIFVLGHVHQTICTRIPIGTEADDGDAPTTLMVVLGHWFHRASWFRIDPDLAWSFWFWDDDAPAPEQVNDQRIEPPLPLKPG